MASSKVVDGFHSACVVECRYHRRLGDFPSASTVMLCFYNGTSLDYRVSNLAAWLHGFSMVLHCCFGKVSGVAAALTSCVRKVVYCIMGRDTLASKGLALLA